MWFPLWWQVLLQTLTAKWRCIITSGTSASSAVILSVLSGIMRNHRRSYFRSLHPSHWSSRRISYCRNNLIFPTRSQVPGRSPCGPLPISHCSCVCQNVPHLLLQDTCPPASEHLLCITGSCVCVPDVNANSFLISSTCH